MQKFIEDLQKLTEFDFANTITVEVIGSAKNLLLNFLVVRMSFIAPN